MRPKSPKATTALPVSLTHPDRVLWPDVGVTKQGLAEFYAEIWPWISPHVVDRPLALVRCPGGIADKCFFQKHAWAGIGEHVIRGKDRLVAIEANPRATSGVSLFLPQDGLVEAITQGKPAKRASRLARCKRSAKAGARAIVFR